ncbi:MAG TPA: discoidin domain-containing protein [Stenomitos sp.]
MLKRVCVVLVTLGLLAAPLRYMASQGPEAWAGDARSQRKPQAVRYFGMQAIPKFDETSGHGSWNGSRARGLAMHQDLGVQLSREGYIWLHDEPEPNQHPNQGDFDDAVHRCQQAGIAVQLMITDTPYWASSAPNKVPDQPDTFRHAPPLNLYDPIFTDGTDVPGKGKQVNPRNYWARMLARVATRYQGAVRYYQVWNEPDYPRGDQGANFKDAERSWQGSVGDYVRMLQVAHMVVKSVDPQASIVTGGIGYVDYLTSMIGKGAGAYFDAVDFHAYGGPGSDTALRAFLSLHGKLRQALRHAGLHKGLMCSETGYPSADPEGQADYIPKLYATGLALGLEGIIWYSNTNPSWHQMGLIDWHRMQQRTAGYWSYKTTSTALAGTTYAGKLPLDPRLVAYRFKAGKREVLVAWAPHRDARHPIPWVTPDKGSWRLVMPDGRTRRLAPGSRLPLWSRPVILDSDPRVAYAPARPNPPRYAGAYEVLGAEAMASEPGGFHEAELAIDGDPDTEWVGTGDNQFTVRLARRSMLKGLSLKTGPMDGGVIEVQLSEDGKTFRTVLSGLSFSDWGTHEVEFPAPAAAMQLRLVFKQAPDRSTGSARLFEVLLR